MSSSTKQAAQTGSKKGGWGSMFSSAVAGLESRLDTILAEDNEASNKARAIEQAVREDSNVSIKGTDSERAKDTTRLDAIRGTTAASRDTSRNRASERLAERLAKATAKKQGGSDAGSNIGSEVPSRANSPAIQESSPRASEELKGFVEQLQSGPDRQSSISQQGETAESTHRAVVEVNEEATANATSNPTQDAYLQSSALPINPAQQPIDSSYPRSSSEEFSRTTPTRPSTELSNGYSDSLQKDVNEELVQTRHDYEVAEKQRQEDMHVYLERIDALQAKLQYLAKETVAAAREANASMAASASPESQLAAKDERIALLMEEGEKLSKTEMRQTQLIRQLRSKQAEHDKAHSTVRQRLTQAETSTRELKEKLLRSDRAERVANEKLKQYDSALKKVDQLQLDHERALETIRDLSMKLEHSKTASTVAHEQANAKTLEADNSRIVALEVEIEDMKIEKKLISDRAAAQVKKTNEESRLQAERFALAELDLKNEISNLESRLEAVRLRAEEVGIDGNAGAESKVKLLRQVETLQSQYLLAKANWETIESSLNTRMATIESERNDAIQKEAEMRKKVRDLATIRRKLEQEAESRMENSNYLAKELESTKKELSEMAERVTNTEDALTNSKTDFQRQCKLWEQELAARIEEEKAKWQRNPTHNNSRKASATDVFSHVQRSRSRHHLASREVSSANISDHSASRRSSAQPSFTNRTLQNPNVMLTPDKEYPPPISRQESNISLDSNNVPPTPTLDLGQDEDLDRPLSPQRTINDLVSNSNAATGTGPSVQLVERMSAAVRRLEAEKASNRDETTRLVNQRDDARNEVVSLMRELDKTKEQLQDTTSLRAEMEKVTRRYETALEVLGEKEEQVEELKADVVELKRIYRDLVEEKVGQRTVK